MIGPRRSGVLAWLTAVALAAACAVVSGQVVVSLMRISRMIRLGSLGRNPVIADASSPGLLADNLYVVHAERRLAPTDEEWVLVLVGTAGSPWGDASAEAWLHFIARVTREELPEVWVVDVGGGISTSMAQQLAALSWYRILRLRDSDREAYYARTGVNGVPTSVLAKRGGRLACVIRGVPTADQLARCWAQTTPEGLGSLFYLNRPTFSGWNGGTSPAPAR